MRSTSAESTASLVRSGRLRADDNTLETLERIAQRDPSINAFTAITAERALADAERVDALVRQKRDPGGLAGVPFAVKNLYDVAGLTTLAGARIEAEKPPASKDATLIAHLREAGAVLVGTLNMDEYAYGFTTENAHYGTTRNPRDLSRIAGGSSGGSAAAVAAGIVPIALGSDTNGSIRVPAAFCGIFGLKPTFGRLSRTGAYPFVDSLDHMGPFAANVRDLALAYDSMQGYDKNDRRAEARGVEPVLPMLDDGIADLRVGVLGGFFARDAEPNILTAVHRVAVALDAHFGVELRNVENARAAAFCLTAAEGAKLHLSDLKTRSEKFDPAVRDRLLAGALLPDSIVRDAEICRARFREHVMGVFEHFDVLISPTTPFVAPRIGQTLIRLGDEEVAVRATAGLYTQPISFIGLPAISVPASCPGLPIGVQLIAAPWREDVLLRVARHLEREGIVGVPPAKELCDAR